MATWTCRYCGMKDDGQAKSRPACHAACEDLCHKCPRLRQDRWKARVCCPACYRKLFRRSLKETRQC